MRRTARLALVVTLAAVCACHSPTAAPVIDPQIAATFQLTTIDTRAVTGVLTDPPYIYGGHLNLIVDGTFIEEYSRVLITAPLGGVAQSSAVPDVHTGFWRELADGRYEFRYADRRPAIVDTSTTTATGFTKGCKAFGWCFSADHLLTFVR